MIEEDARFLVLKVAESFGISSGSVNNILHDVLGLRKFSARWVPHMFDRWAEMQEDTTEGRKTLFGRSSVEMRVRFTVLTQKQNSNLNNGPQLDKSPLRNLPVAALSPNR